MSCAHVAKSATITHRAPDTLAIYFHRIVGMIRHANQRQRWWIRLLPLLFELRRTSRLIRLGLHRSAFNKFPIYRNSA